MKEFEEWFDTFEGDGGELLLYNAIDLEEAFRAGMLAAAEIAEQLIDPAKSTYEDHQKDLARLECRDAIRKAAQGGE